MIRKIFTKRRIITIAIILVVIIALHIIIQKKLDEHNKPRITRDDEAYITESYVDPNNDDIKIRKGSQKAQLFLPKYEDISEEIERFEFYTVLKWNDIWHDYLYYLDTFYTDQSKYEETKQELLSRHKEVAQGYADRGGVGSVTRRIGKYECYIGGEGDCFFGVDKYGMFYGMYCFDDSSKTIRYVYFYNGSSSSLEIDIYNFEATFDWE